MLTADALWVATRDHANSLLNDGRACKLCGGEAGPFGTVDFNKSCNNYPLPRSGIAVQYFRCADCDLLFTDFCDEWSGQDFAKFIYNDSYVLVDPDYIGTRARGDAAIYAEIFAPAKGEVRILDYGGGMGVFARSLGEHGFGKVATFDPFASPERPEGKFDIVTAFEVIEHSAEPLGTLEDLLSFVGDGGCLIVGQSMQPADITTVRCDWWYVAPRNGHITFYSHRTMERFAKAHNLVYRYTTQGAFVLYRAQVSEATRAILDAMESRVQFLTLRPPAGNSAGWHDLEMQGTREFRWTRNAEIDLGEVAIVEGDNYIQLDVIMAIEPRFLNTCVLQIGSDLVPLSDNAEGLFAHHTSSSSTRCTVRLLTPQPIMPKALDNGSSDGRELGLAILV